MNKEEIKKHRNIKLKPEDVKIGTLTEVFWADFKRKLDADILQGERQLEVNRHLLQFAVKKIMKEKATFK